MNEESVRHWSALKGIYAAILIKEREQGDT